MGAPMRIVSKCHDSTFATVADFSLDANGNPRSLAQKDCHMENFRCGTRVRLQLPVQEYSCSPEMMAQLLSRGMNVHSPIWFFFNPSFMNQ
mmetsp:Transcript_32248/g.46527  ORF Transcript_32248/g.46527 Transcript_32248/m.46527 type:complete len:91 (-) Transcript_32248:33-305(-)